MGKGVNALNIAGRGGKENEKNIDGTGSCDKAGFVLNGDLARMFGRFELIH